MLARAPPPRPCSSGVCIARAHPRAAAVAARPGTTRTTTTVAAAAAEAASNGSAAAAVAGISSSSSALVTSTVGKSTNILWHECAIGQKERQGLLNQKGCVVWITGLSGSGKSTLACALSRELHGRGHLTYVLDGDNLRHGLNRDLSFGAEDRAENIRRVAMSLLVCLNLYFRGSSEAVRRRWPRLHRQPHIALQKRPKRVSRSAAQALVYRGVPGRAASSVRSQGPQRPLQARTRRQNQRVHRHRRSLRTAVGL
ncbi:adenylyl-sulfate kinase 3 isoform X2 [Zea mays]|uniref:adenylyl-sulfate kinase 3 isoform X2 n=1 Tax=Zea mays TaxID=4577 RepID=UPI0009A99E01|nr:uncharacterized protein LOC100193315 isoform X2 [Zea mays]|eukprot:XP_020406873.1 uncharacterized protein LOC100193315 isoform X2 [Zea mays]